jgi:hypothetical protein
MLSEIQPPRIGPATGAISVVIDHSASAIGAFARG